MKNIGKIQRGLANADKGLSEAIIAFPPDENQFWLRRIAETAVKVQELIREMTEIQAAALKSK